MNNTLSQSGLSYSHPSYASHHPTSHGVQQTKTLSLPTGSSSNPTSYSTNALQQNIPLPTLSRSNLTAMPHHQQQIIHSQHQVGLAHSNPPGLSLPLHSSNVTPNVYPQSSVFINPYMGMLSPTNHVAHTHHLQYHTPYIAPPPGFSVPSQASDAGSYGTLPPYTSAGSSHHYPGVLASTSGPLVPYHHQQYQPQHYPPPPPPYMQYRVGANSWVCVPCSFVVSCRLG